MSSPPIQYIHRPSGEKRQEDVYGKAGVDLLYGSSPGFFFTDLLLKRKWISRWIGSYEDTSMSRKKIPGFIEKFKIQMEEYEEGPFHSFNEFFTRKFKPGMRKWPEDPGVFPSPCEGRILLVQGLDGESRLPIKGNDLSPVKLLHGKRYASFFEGGDALVIRLCPVDYHRFHFPCSGRVTDYQEIPGGLHSVNPVALGAKKEIFVENHRVLTMVEHPDFGSVGLLEVGALMVGKIRQTFRSAPPYRGVEVEQGQEKGLFLFGGSTVIVLLQKGKISWDEDLLKNQDQGFETWVPLGDPLGSLKTV